MWVSDPVRVSAPATRSSKAGARRLRRQESTFRSVRSDKLVDAERRNYSVVAPTSANRNTRPYAAAAGAGFAAEEWRERRRLRRQPCNICHDTAAVRRHSIACRMSRYCRRRGPSARRRRWVGSAGETDPPSDRCRDRGCRADACRQSRCGTSLPATAGPADSCPG
jgi:hypothetical protein